MKGPLLEAERTALAERLSRCGEIAIAMELGGIAPTTLRRARDGATVYGTTLYAIRAYLARCAEKGPDAT